MKYILLTALFVSFGVQAKLVQPELKEASRYSHTSKAEEKQRSIASSEKEAKAEREVASEKPAAQDASNMPVKFWTY